MPDQHKESRRNIKAILDGVSKDEVARTSTVSRQAMAVDKPLYYYLASGADY